MKTGDETAERRRKLSGTRQGLVGLGLLTLAYVLWVARDVIPDLATTQIVATAWVSILHDASEADLQRALAAANVGSPAEATFERDDNPKLHDVTYSIHVAADRPELAKAELSALIDALKSAFPSAERNLMVSENNSTTASPNPASQRRQRPIPAPDVPRAHSRPAPAVGQQAERRR